MQKKSTLLQISEICIMMYQVCFFSNTLLFDYSTSQEKRPSVSQTLSDDTLTSRTSYTIPKGDSCSSKSKRQKQGVWKLSLSFKRNLMEEGEVKMVG
ncbi:hypothetical protein CEXT_12141 [Caerostris extrusa]|uniref:Uncharacterized protein n=1 Tax=Caerostris extrusa TaxID=172846 RepID=A0AAV4MW48_CAEEX|nr:hypothetical protein CEXT_12141 [Caerostris extrusa]